MMLTKCYYIVYHVADFAADNVSICHQDTYRDHNNALLVAKDLAKCFDVVDDVYVIDGLTGEVLNTILKDAPQEDKTEENDVPTDNTDENNTSTNTAKKDDAPISSGIFEDGTGGVWQLIEDNKWSYQCLGVACSDCAYCDGSHCFARDPMTEEERDNLIKSARKRVFVKTGETEEKENSSSNGIFDDGIGGVWKLAKNNTWSYNCKGLDCLDCAYYDEGRCSASGHVTKEERDILIKSAKARVKK